MFRLFWKLSYLQGNYYISYTNKDNYYIKSLRCTMAPPITRVFFFFLFFFSLRWTVFFSSFAWRFCPLDQRKINCLHRFWKFSCFISAPVQASFRLQKPVSLLSVYTSRLEREILDEIGVPNAKVSCQDWAVIFF